MKQYEFNILKANDMPGVDKLNEIGKDGWLPTVAFKTSDDFLYIIWAREVE